MTNTDINLHKKAIIRFPNLDERLIRKYSKNDGLLAANATAVIPADTNGWDTVFAIRIKDVNSAIRLQKSSPADFSQHYVDPETDDDITITGVFGDWQLTTGGDGKNLHMSVPIKTGTMTRNGKPYDMAGDVATIEVNCDFVPPPVKGIKPSKDGSLHDLKLKTTSDDPLSPPVSVTGLNFAGKNPGMVIESIMKGVLEIWFNLNLSSFNQVFAVANLNLLADGSDGSFQWLQPTWSSYACSSGPDDESSFFGVLCMIDNHDPAGLAHQLSSAAIPTDQRSSFMISTPMFMQYIVLPGLPGAFVNAQASDFELANNNTSIVNKSGVKLEMPGVKEGAIIYTPYVTSFELILEASEIKTTMKTTINISPGINAYVDTITHDTIQLHTTTVDGVTKQYLDYKQVKDPEVSSYTHTDDWVIVTEAIAAIIVAVIGIAVGAIFEDLLPRIITAIIVIIVSGVISSISVIIEQVIAKGAAEAMPPIDPLVSAATDSINWPTSADFTLTDARINGTFQLLGDPNFADSPAQLQAITQKAG